MKKTVCLVFCWFISVMAVAQQQEIDSLKALLELPRLPDTTRINTLNSLAYDYAFLEPATGLQYGSQAVSLCKQLSNNNKLSTAYNYKALNYTNLGKDSLAVACYDSAIAVARRYGNKKSEGKALNNLAILYTNRAEYKKALEGRLAALAIFREIDDKHATGGIWNNLGVTYLYLADFPQALSSYFKALEIAQQLDDKPGQARALMNIGLVYKKLENYPQAFRYYQQASDLFKSLGDEQQMAGIWANMASAYDETGKHAQALALYHQALAVNRRRQLKREQGSNLADIGIVYSSMQQYDSAWYAFREAQALFAEAPDNNAQAVISNEMASMILTVKDTQLHVFGLTPSTRYAHAADYARQGIALSQESEAVEREMAGWQLLSTIYEKQKQYDEALRDYKHYTQLKDSIFNDEKKIAVTRAEIQYAADKDAALAQAAVQREKIIRNAVLAGGVIIAAAALTLFIGYKKRRDSRQLQRELGYRSRVAETELKVLRLQMNPHFLFNALNSIGQYIHQQDTKAADYYLAKFAGLMRNTLEHAGEQEVSLHTELDMTRQYLQLEAMRLKDPFTYEIITATDIAVQDVMVPPLLLQPFVENSIWHGFAATKGQGHITIHITRNAALLHLTVTDNGSGFHPSAVSERRSFGVKITRERLQLLNTSDLAEVGITLVPQEQGVRVEIVIPYKTTAVA